MAQTSALFDRHGKRIPEGAVRSGMRLSIASMAIGMTWNAIQGMPLTMFLEALGASGLLIGLTATVYQISQAVQIPAAVAAERLGSRRRFWLSGSLVGRSFWIVPAILVLAWPHEPTRVAGWTVLVVGLSWAFCLGVLPTFHSWVADLVPETTRGRFFGLQQSLVALVFMLATWLYGRLLDAFPSPGSAGGNWRGFVLCFAIGTGVGLAAVLMHAAVPEPVAHLESEARRLLSRILQPLRNAEFRRLTIVTGLLVFSNGMLSLTLVYLRRNLGLSYVHISAITISSSLGVVVLGLFWGQIMDRIGARALGTIMLVLAPLHFFPWLVLKNVETDFVSLVQGVPVMGTVAARFVSLLPTSWAEWVRAYTLPQPVWLFCPASFLASALYGGFGVCQLSLMSGLAPKEGRTMAMAVYWTSAGLVGSLGGVAGGKIMDAFVAHPVHYVFPTGTPFDYVHVLVALSAGLFWFVMLPLFLGLRGRPGELPVSTAFLRLLVLNPVRAFPNIYLAGAPVSRKRRARAVRRLGSRRAAIAVSDLIEKLDDAAAEVREEAVYALGEVGSPEAVDALVAKLEDPESDLAPQVAKALRRTRDPRSVDALVRKLSEPDRETRSEAARTLGEIGDRRAVQSLLTMLSQSEDAKVVAAASDALASLGEVAAIYEILPRMKAARNPVLKRSLAVAVGDLLGKPDDFYKVLTREDQTPGTESARLLREIRRAIQQAVDRRFTTEAEVLGEKTKEIETLYGDGRFTDCVDPLFDLTIGMAALQWGVEFGGESKAAINDLIWRDRHVGVGVWYLNMLREGWEGTEPAQRDRIEILLGIYFVLCFSRRLTGERHESRTARQS